MVSRLLLSRRALRGLSRATTVTIGAAFSTHASAAVIDANPSSYQSLLSSLTAGDTMRLAPGTYTHGLQLAAMSGTAAQPIAIVGPDDQSAVFVSEGCCNGLQLDGTSYVHVRNLTLSGGTRAGSPAVDSRGSSHHILLDNLKIVGFTRTAGIATHGPAWNWIIRHNVIQGAGTGLVLGEPGGTQPFIGGVIEYNAILDTRGSNLEIESQTARPTGMELPVASSQTIIRHNVFSKQNSGTTNGGHPNVLLGHFPLSGTGARDSYDIYGNFFYQNLAGALLEAEGNLRVHDNLFVNVSGDAVLIEPREDRPREVYVFQNTVVATGVGLRVDGGDAAFVQRLTANISFAGVPVSGPNQTNNVTGPYESAGEYLNAPYAPVGTLDLSPKSGGVRIAAVTAAAAPSVTLSASPANVASGGTSVLSWTSTGVDACSASGGWSGTKAANGSATVGPLQSTTSFQLTCLGAAGNANAITQVTVGGASTPPTDPTPPTNPDPTPPTDPSPAPTDPSQPTDPPVTDPAPPTESPTEPSPGTGEMKSGGGGALDGLLIAALALLAALRLPTSLHPRHASALRKRPSSPQSRGGSAERE